MIPSVAINNARWLAASAERVVAERGAHGVAAHRYLEAAAYAITDDHELLYLRLAWIEAERHEGRISGCGWDE